MKSNADKVKSRLRKIFQNLVVLNNEHKVAVLLTYQSKSGQLVFGPENVKEKMKSSFNCPCVCTCEENQMTWEKAFTDANLDLIRGNQLMDIDPVGMFLISYLLL